MLEDDPALRVKWQKGRRAWQRYYGRWLPGYALHRLARRDGTGALNALRLLVLNAPASFEGVIGYRLPAICPASWRRPEWPAEPQTVPVGVQ